MPSPAETTILLYVLGFILASLPVAMLLWRRSPGPAYPPPLPPPVAPRMEGPETPWMPPMAPLIEPPPLPMAPRSRFGRADAWFALGLALMVSVLMGPLSSVIAGYVAEQSGKPEEALKIEYTASLFMTQIFFQGGIITIILVWLAAIRKFDVVRFFGFRERSALMTLGLAVLWLIVAYVLILIYGGAIAPLLKDLLGMDLKQQGLVESAPDIQDPFTRVLMVITLCVGAPLMEELIFRGVIYGVAVRYFHPVYATIASAVLFGAIHNNLLSLIPLSLLGAVLAEAYRHSRSLGVPIVMHSVFNGISYLLLMYGPPEVRNQ